MMLGQERLAEATLAVWRRGGADALATARPYLASPDPAEPIGLCTALRFLLGLTPIEIAALLALTSRDFASGAEIFVVSPLPGATEFELVGYAPKRPAPPPPPEPDPDAEDRPVQPLMAPPPSHPIYPPAFGPPRWKLAAVPQSRLSRIASLERGRPFVFETRLLPRLAP